MRVAGTRTDVGRRLRTEASTVVIVCQPVGVTQWTTHRPTWHCHTHTHTHTVQPRLPVIYTSTGADLRQKASSATLPERPPLPSLLLPPLSLSSPALFPPLPSLRSRPPQIQLGVWGSASCKLPQRGLGRSPSRNRIWYILALKSDIWWWWQQF